MLCCAGIDFCTNSDLLPSFGTSGFTAHLGIPVDSPPLVGSSVFAINLMFE